MLFVAVIVDAITNAIAVHALLPFLATVYWSVILLFLLAFQTAFAIPATSPPLVKPLNNNESIALSMLPSHDFSAGNA